MEDPFLSRQEKNQKTVRKLDEYAHKSLDDSRVAVVISKVLRTNMTISSESQSVDGAMSIEK